MGTVWRKRWDSSRRSRVSGVSKANGTLHYFEFPSLESKGNKHKTKIDGIRPECNEGKWRGAKRLGVLHYFALPSLERKAGDAKEVQKKGQREACPFCLRDSVRACANGGRDGIRTHVPPIGDNRISSAGRYNHFDTLPYHRRNYRTPTRRNCQVGAYILLQRVRLPRRGECVTMYI